MNNKFHCNYQPATLDSIASDPAVRLQTPYHDSNKALTELVAVGLPPLKSKVQIAVVDI